MEKVLGTVLWDSRGLLKHLKQADYIKRPHLSNKKVIFRQIHKSSVVAAELQEFIHTHHI